jgi:glycosyltransferase involved in cell wall biosynthesis
MKSKRVLVVGMLDSIHLARWVEQFKDSEIELRILPSTYFRKVHPRLERINGYRDKFRIPGLNLFGNIYGYVDYISTLSFLNHRLEKYMRVIFFRLYILFFRPDIIHAIELQHAGYIASLLGKLVPRRIVTNWGSDIYFFQHERGHKRKIAKTLSWATHYSAECQRDYLLASSFGFKGINLPCIPNAGGFDMPIAQLKAASDRNLILVKAYGGKFGLGKMAGNVIIEILKEFSDLEVHFYSVTRDLKDLIEKIQILYPDRVKFTTLENPLSHEDLMSLFAKARIYLGCSRSDGLSTSFLQAVITGAYPIQTNTSCAGELILEGAIGSIVEPREDIIMNELRKVVTDWSHLNSAQNVNFIFAMENLNKEKIGRLARSYYDSK